MGILVIITGIVITFSIIGVVFFALFSGISNTTKVENSNANVQGKAISRKTVFFSDKYANCYFDEEHLYVEQAGAKTKFPLRNITEISDTKINLSGGRIWQIKVIDEKGQNMLFKFVPNATIISSEDFLEFLETVRKIDSSVVKSEWKWWKK